MLSSVTLGMGLQYGFDSPFFAISILFSILFIHNFINMGRSVNKNSKLIDIFFGDIIKQKKAGKNRIIIKKKISIHSFIDIIIGIIIGAIITLLYFYIKNYLL